MPAQHDHEAARKTRDAARRPLILSPFVLAEVDYFVAKWAGVGAEIEVLAEVARDAYTIAPFGAGDIAEAVAVVEAYSEIGIGLADASIVVLAGRYGTNRVLTLDERHFRALRTPTGKKFAVLPADA